MLTDRTVAALYAEPVLGALRKAGWRASLFVQPPGERSKTIRTVARIWSGLLEEGFDRGTTVVVALGGGVVGDVAGFVASSYMRGVGFVQVPTTLLAQVDASVGGKTGFNLPGAKNAVGAFYQPRMVYASLASLRTQRPRDFRAGLAEVIKHGAIARPGILDALSVGDRALHHDPARLEGVIAACCEVKRDVVEADEREAGLRRILNFGHTFGHAIEVMTRHRLRHGEAVALGMISACRVSEALGFCDRSVRDALTDLMRGVGLDTDDRPYFNRQAVELMRRDKKLHAGRVAFVVLRELGAVDIAPLALAELDAIVSAG